MRSPRHRRVPPRLKRAGSVQSGDGVWDQARAQALDLVFENQLALLQALQLQAVERGVGRNAIDHVIEVVVLDLEAVKAAPDLRLLLFGQGEVGHRWKT